MRLASARRRRADFDGPAPVHSRDDTAPQPVLPQPGSRPVSGGGPRWDSWPYDALSDDEDYGRNVPAWFDDHQDELLSLTDDSDGGGGDDGDAGDTDGGGAMHDAADGGLATSGDESAEGDVADLDDDAVFEWGDFYDPFNRRMVCDAPLACALACRSPVCVGLTKRRAVFARHTAQGVRSQWIDVESDSDMIAPDEDDEEGEADEEEGDEPGDAAGAAEPLVPQASGEAESSAAEPDGAA